MSRRSADETRTQLIDALVHLLRDAPMEAISVRQIATLAGVNHGLVHRYFGSKEELLKAAIRRISDEIFAGAPGTLGMSAWTFRFLEEHPHPAAVAARACLAGQSELLSQAAPDEARQREILAPLQRLLARAGLGDTDAAALNGFATAAFLGWFTSRPMLATAFGVKPDAERDIERLLVKLDALVAIATPRAT